MGTKVKTCVSMRTLTKGRPWRRKTDDRGHCAPSWAQAASTSSHPLSLKGPMNKGFEMAEVRVMCGLSNMGFHPPRPTCHGTDLQQQSHAGFPVWVPSTTSVSTATSQLPGGRWATRKSAQMPVCLPSVQCLCLSHRRGWQSALSTVTTLPLMRALTLQQVESTGLPHPTVLKPLGW